MTGTVAALTWVVLLSSCISNPPFFYVTTPAPHTHPVMKVCLLLVPGRRPGWFWCMPLFWGLQGKLMVCCSSGSNMWVETPWGVAYQIFTLQFITSSIRVWSSNKISFMVPGHQNMRHCVKGSQHWGPLLRDAKERSWFLRVIATGSPLPFD